MKAPLHLVHHRVRYYALCIKAMIKSMHVPHDRICFITESTYQLSPAYTLDTIRLVTEVFQRDAFGAGAEVTKQSQNPSLSGLWYPGMQALDEQYLGSDAAQRHRSARNVYFCREIFAGSGVKETGPSSELYGGWVTRW
jgi:tyrosyl-tRNA synthetase